MIGIKIVKRLTEPNVKRHCRNIFALDEVLEAAFLHLEDVLGHQHDVIAVVADDPR